MEKLKESGAITIEIVRQQEGQSVAEMERNAMTLLKESVIGEFFRPAMSNTAAQNPAAAATTALTQAQGLMASSANTNQGTAGAGASVQIGFQLQYKTQEELREATFDYSVIAAETRTHAPNGFFSALLTGTEKNKHIRDVDLDDEFFKVLEVQTSTTADFAALDLRSIVVELQYGGTIAAPRATATIVITPEDQTPKVFRAFRDEQTFAYRYRVAYKFGQSEQVAAQRQDYQSPWRDVTSRALVVHPSDDVAMLRVFLEPGVVDWDVVDSIESRLVYEDPGHGFRAERTFLLQAGAARQTWVVRLSDPAMRAYRIRHIWHLKGNAQTEGEEHTSTVSHVFVGDPFVDRLPILIHPQVDPANVLRALVELRYEDPEHAFEVRKNVELVGPNYGATTVTLPIIDRERREYTYQISLIKAGGGAAENQHEVRTEQLSIIVTEGGVYLDLSVVLLGDMAAHQILAIQLDLRSEPLDGAIQKVESHLFEAGKETRTAKRLLLRADRPRRFEYRTLVFLASGESVEGEWTAHDRAILPIPIAKLVP
jgi:hypothetical protein